MRDNLVRSSDGEVRCGAGNAPLRLGAKNDQIHFPQIRQIQNAFGRIASFDEVFRLAPDLSFVWHELAEQLFRGGPTRTQVLPAFFRARRGAWSAA